MLVKIKKLVPEAVMPKKAHGSDAGYDLVAVRSWLDDDGAVAYGFGIAVEIPEGYVGLVFPRSSIVRKDLALSNAVGVIDAGYIGEITARFKLAFPLQQSYDLKTSWRWYDVGDRIAQLVILKLPEVELVEADELRGGDRGTGGYGSTGR